MAENPNINFEFLADRPEFVPLVIDWWRTVWADRMGSERGPLEDQLRNSLSSCELPIHVLALSDGRPVGTAALKRQELGELFPEYHYWLGSVFVEEQSRGMQIASSLSLHVVELARSMNLPHLYLQTIALEGGLYRQIGWEPVEEFSYMDEHALLMLKRLQAPA